MSETRQRNGHTIVLDGCVWKCRQCGHKFDALVDADLFWCGEDCTGKHPGDRTGTSAGRVPPAGDARPDTTGGNR